MIRKLNKFGQLKSHPALKSLGNLRNSPAVQKMKQPIQRLQGAVDKKYIQFRFRNRSKTHALQKIPLLIDSSRYVVRTISSWDDLREVLRLRYFVFIREGLKRRKPIGVDLDQFDEVADHLVVQDKSSGEIVGTYRLISSQFSQNFYSESEFDFQGFLAEPGHKLELGRACIHPDHRTGAAIAMLWKGLHEYMSLSESRFLFGCASLKVTKLEEVAAIYYYLLENGFISDRWDIHPKPRYRMEGLTTGLSHGWESAGLGQANQVPSLLKAYFKAGAKVLGEPALDRDFQCIDFFTVLEKDLLASSFDRKFSLR